MEPRKHYFAKIPTIAIFIVMAMSGPLGVLLFILKGIDQKVQKEEQEAAAVRGGFRFPVCRGDGYSGYHRCMAGAA